MGDGGTKGNASKIESVVEVLFESARDDCDMRGLMSSSNDLGTPCAGGDSCPAERDENDGLNGEEAFELDCKPRVSGLTSWALCALLILATMVPAVDIVLPGRLLSQCTGDWWSSEKPNVDAEALERAEVGRKLLSAKGFCTLRESRAP